MKYAEVAVNSPLTQPRTFSYAIPPNISLGEGHAVWVPFGPRLIQGIVVTLSDYPSVEDTKEIAQAIGSEPILSQHQVELCRWIAERYLSSYFEAAALMLPPGFERRVITFIQPIPNPSDVTLSSLTGRQREILYLLQQKGKVKLKELKQLGGRDRIEDVLEQLVRKGLAVKTQELERAKVRPRLVTYLNLAVPTKHARRAIASLERKRATQQVKLLQFLIQEPHPISLPETRERLGVTSEAVKTLHRKGLISLEEVRVQRDPLAHRTFAPTPPHTLTPDQDEAWSRIAAEMVRLARGEPPLDNAPSVFLIHGVTGSGKTEIYMRAAAQAISLGKRVIVLVPEIALTPQTISRFAARFPNRVALLHSKLSLGEQFDIWQRIRDGDFDVVIGSRGALFAPQPDLGLIVMDEEHEWTYKQHEQPPRYHARDVAIKLAGLTNAVLILGSATPDVTSYYQAQRGRFKLLKLPQRISSGEVSTMPQVEVVDLRRELSEGNRSIFSRSLARAIAESLAAREQVILFLNRRGTATFVQCRDCGLVLRCPRCEVSLTYHAAVEDLVCHYCNYRTKVPHICPNCLSKRIKFLGIGTQKVEEEVAKAFPEAQLLRWDRDVTKGKHSHEQIMARFLAHEADILIGTQMIAKGLDMPLVTLVGVINADIGLYLPDFRSSERTFQILAQVAGRAGRGKSGGKVIVQSYTPEHYAIVAASNHDYPAFYKQEISFRRQQGDPPFSKLARLIYTHTNAGRCQKEAERVYNLLEQNSNYQELSDTSLLGPTPSFTQRVRGRFRWQIIIRSPDPLPLLSQLSLPHGWSVDIDPVSLV
ncbi:MAG TPA: primosomal protein N' [Dehalococcoidia bacterium]|nr:primosomal protein N' [Dehalococcoidia bacterium]